jgi:hypothetical protein
LYIGNIEIMWREMFVFVPAKGNSIEQRRISEWLWDNLLSKLRSAQKVDPIDWFCKELSAEDSLAKSIADDFSNSLSEKISWSNGCLAPWTVSHRPCRENQINCPLHTTGYYSFSSSSTR